MPRSFLGATCAVALMAQFACGAAPSDSGEAETQAYVPPRTPDGVPDLQGVWQVLNSADVNILDHSAGSDGPAGHGVVEGNEIPYQDWAVAQQQENYANREASDPVRQCFLPGVPRATYIPLPFQIIQAEGHVLLLYEFVHAQRRVYTNDTPHVQDIDAWMGDSRGHWEGDTLVVDVTNFNGLTWLDRAGNFHSEALHVVERYTPVGPDHIQYEATIEDPNVYTRPWTMSMMLYRHKEPNAQLFDYQCYAFDHGEEGLTVPLFRYSTLE